MQLAEFLIFFQKSGSYVKLRTSTMEIDRFRVVSATLEVWNSATRFGIIFIPETYNPETRSRSWPTCMLRYCTKLSPLRGRWRSACVLELASLG